MIGQRDSLRIDEVADRFRRCSRSDGKAASGEPVEACMHDPANPSGRPENERETPFRHPIAKVSILFDAFNVVMQRAVANVV